MTGRNEKKPRRAAGAGRWPALAAVAAAILMGAGAAGCRSTYYALMESAGREKRDLLRSALEETNRSQSEASDRFRGALGQLKALYAFTGGDLEERYDGFRREYERSRAAAEDFRGRARALTRVSDDLFAEWEAEIADIGSPELQKASRYKLASSRVRMRKIARGLAASESRMATVLSRTKDYALYLKHSLNAEAVGGLETEAIGLEKDIAGLISDMRASIVTIEVYLKELDDGEPGEAYLSAP